MIIFSADIDTIVFFLLGAGLGALWFWITGQHHPYNHDRPHKYKDRS